MADDMDRVELRGSVARLITDVLDAVSMARDTNRMVIVEEVLREWAEKKLHEAKLIHRVARREGSPAAEPGTGTENSAAVKR